jgi:hypothetical protein
MGKPYLRKVSVVDQLPFSKSVILFDDCQGAFPYLSEGTGTEIAEYDTAHTYFNSKAIKLGTQASSPTAGDYVQIKIPLNILNFNKMLLSFAIFSTMADEAPEIYTQISKGDGSFLYTAGFKYNGINPDIYLYTSESAWSLLSGYDPSIRDTEWTFIDLKFDFQNVIYDFIQINGDLKNASDIAVNKTSSSTTYGQFLMNIKIPTGLSSQIICWINNLFILQD